MAGCEGESVAIYCSHVRAVVGFIINKYRERNKALYIFLRRTKARPGR